MNRDKDKSKAQLLSELKILRHRVAELEARVATCGETDVGSIPESVDSKITSSDQLSLSRDSTHTHSSKEQKKHNNIEDLKRNNFQLQQINSRLHRIVESTRDIFLCSHVRELGSRLLAEFGRLMMAEGGSLYMVEDEGLRLFHALDPGHASDFIPYPLQPGTVFQRVLSERKPVLISDEEKLKTYSTSKWGGYKGSSVLVFPLPDKEGTIIGLVSLHSKTPSPFIEQDKEIGSILASYSYEALRAAQAIEALEKSNARFKSLAENIPDIISRYDRECRYIYVSPAIEKYGILKLNDFIGKCHRDIGLPEDQCMFWEQNIETVFETGEPFETEFEFESLKGPVIFNWRLFPEVDKKGRILSVLSVSRDVTERRLAEKAVHRQSEALEQSLDGIVIADLEGNLLFVNSACAIIHGYDPSELTGKHLSVFHTEEQMRSEVIPSIERVKKIGGFKGEVGHLAQNGTTFPTRMSITLLRDEDGVPVGIVMTAHDIAEELKLEAQLRQAQKMESVGRLAGGIAHDFNNLLSPILGYAEMLMLDLSSDDPRHDDLMQVKKAAERAKGLTRQILAFSRKQVLEMKKVNLNRVVSEFEKIIRRIIREDIELRIKKASSLGNIKADISQLEQILMNLVVNAQDAMPHGGRMIIETADVILDKGFTQTHPGAILGHYIMLSISDTGVGMAGDTVKHVFEPFFTTKELGKGTGLGLSTVYGIVKQHGGYIWVYSEPDLGTTFKIHFPFIDNALEDTQPQFAQRKIVNGCETVLVVEDDEMSRQLICSILKKHGYNVLDTGNAMKCMNLLEQYQEHIDLLITDVVMPRMNGKELYQQLSSYRPDLKVLYISGYVGDVIGHHGVLDEGVNFLQKPLSVQTLTVKIREVLDAIPDE